MRGLGDRPRAFARKIRCNPLKRLIPRPGSRPLSPRSAQARPTRSTTASTSPSAPATARKIRRKPLKWLIPRPGSRPLSPRSAQARPTRSTTAPASPSAPATARKIRRKTLKRLNPRPGLGPCLQVDPVGRKIRDRPLDAQRHGGLLKALLHLGRPTTVASRMTYRPPSMVKSMASPGRRLRLSCGLATRNIISIAGMQPLIAP